MEEKPPSGTSTIALEQASAHALESQYFSAIIMNTFHFALPSSLLFEKSVQ